MASFLKKFFKKKSPSEIEVKMGYIFNNQQLLKTALTHRSTTEKHYNSYERLEFLGDAVLELVVSEYLYKKYPLKPEGSLTELRSVLVNGEYLSKIALDMDICKYCIVDKSLNLQNALANRKIMSNILESIIGAIYLDSNLETVTHFIARWILKDEIENLQSQFNFKGQLYEVCQKSDFSLPQFIVQKVSGPDHARNYTVAVKIDKSIFGTGFGKTKKEAEQEAAEKAIEKITKIKK